MISCGRPVVKVVRRLHGSRRHTQFLDVPGSNVNYLIDVLENTFDEQELGIRHKRPVSLVKLRIDDSRVDLSPQQRFRLLGVGFSNFRDPEAEGTRHQLFP